MENASTASPARVIDLITPMARAARTDRSSPAPQDELLQTIANSITRNHPEVTLIVLLIDDGRKRGPICRGLFKEGDQPRPSTSLQLATCRWLILVIEKRNGLVEHGRDVVSFSTRSRGLPGA